MSKYIFLKKKIILGKTKKIYTKKGSKKEYVKYKNRMINIAKYKKIKNYNSKKMKGGVPRAPSQIRRQTRNPSKTIREIRGPSLINRTPGHSLIERTKGPPQIRPTRIIIKKNRFEKLYSLEDRKNRAMKANLENSLEDLEKLQLSEQKQEQEPHSKTKTRIRFGKDTVHKIAPISYMKKLHFFTIKRSLRRPTSRRPTSRRRTSHSPSDPILRK